MKIILTNKKIKLTLILVISIIQLKVSVVASSNHEQRQKLRTQNNVNRNVVAINNNDAGSSINTFTKKENKNIKRKKEELILQYREMHHKIHNKQTQISATTLSSSSSSSQIQSDKIRNNEKIKVILKLKKNILNSNEILADNYSLKIEVDRLGIYAGYLTYNEIQEINDHVEYIEPDTDVFIIDDIINKRSYNNNNLRRKLKKSNDSDSESIPWGINAVLQDISFWDNEILEKNPKNKIKICVCDTGYELGHEDLPSDSADVTGSNNSNIDEEWSFDGHGHGTHVAGVIAALGNNKGVRGIIPNNQNGNFELVIAKAFSSNGFGSESSVVNAVESCVNQGANIISLSLGSYNYNKISSEYYNDLYVNKGILVIAASGNDGTNSFMYPSGYSSVVSVGAVDEKDEHALFSQYNNQVEISAPGVSVYSTYKDNGYVSYDGTSMATPHVAGVAGLLWMYFPQCTNQQIRNVMLATAATNTNNNDDDDDCNEMNGYGLIQAIDAYKLLEQGECGQFVDHVNNPLGGCQQIGAYSKTCVFDSDCNDNDPCTVDKCNAIEGTCMSSILDCTQCNMIDKVTINILPDLYPTEVTWELINTNDQEENNIMLGSGGPYPEMKLYTISQCLNAGAYQFTIYDEFGDGVCCDDGRNGSYNITIGGDGSASKNTDTILIKSGGDYKLSESITFDIIDTTAITTKTLKPTKKPTKDKKNKTTKSPTTANKTTKKPKTKKPTKEPTKKNNKKLTKKPKTKNPTKKPTKKLQIKKSINDNSSNNRSDKIKKNNNNNDENINNDANKAWKRLNKQIRKQHKQKQKKQQDDGRSRNRNNDS